MLSFLFSGQLVKWGIRAGNLDGTRQKFMAIVKRYLLEPDDMYEEEITPLILQNKVKLLSTPL